MAAKSRRPRSLCRMAHWSRRSPGHGGGSGCSMTACTPRSARSVTPRTSRKDELGGSAQPLARGQHPDYWHYVMYDGAGHARGSKRPRRETGLVLHPADDWILPHRLLRDRRRGHRSPRGLRRSHERVPCLQQNLRETISARRCRRSASRACSRWCLYATRWKEALDADVAPPVVPVPPMRMRSSTCPSKSSKSARSTDPAELRHISREPLCSDGI